jgi:isoamylase
VWLLLFDHPDGNPTDIIRVQDQDRFAWHVFVHGAGAGQIYGYKVRGPFDPARGFRFNDRKLLTDPYAKALTGKIVNEDNLLLAYDTGDPARDLSLDRRENQRTDISSTRGPRWCCWGNESTPGGTLR